MQSENRGHFYPFKIVAAVALIMAAVMFTGTPLGAIVKAEGPGTGKYLKRTVFVEAPSIESAKEAIKNEKLVLMPDEVFSNTGGNKKTFLAYETTDNGAEAITDIKAMNMKGGWSYKEYKDYLDGLKNQAVNSVKGLMPAVVEFREQYNKDKTKENVKIAYEILNRIKDTDLKENNGLADIMLSDKFTEDDFAKYFLEGNARMVSLIETALLIGCGFTNEKNFAEGLETFEFTGEYDCSEYASYSDVLLSEFGKLKKSIELYEKSGVTFDAGKTEQDMKEYIDTIQDDEGYNRDDPEANDNLLSSEQKKVYYSTGAGVYQIVKEIRYETKKNPSVKNLLDFIKSDIEEYAIEDFYPLIAGMSAGQLALIPAGLEQHLFLSQQSRETLRESYTATLSEEGITEDTVYDLYYNVNRRIYNPSGIAMTSEVTREAAKGKTDWAKGENEHSAQRIENYNKTMKICGIIGGSIVGAGLITWVIAGLVNPAFFAFSTITKYTGEVLMHSLGWIGLIVLVTFVISSLIPIFVSLAMREIEKKSPKVNKWLDIPQIICSKEKRNAKDYYIYYDGVANLKGEVIDVGQKLSEEAEREWLALYTTTDSRAGKPILTEEFKLIKAAPTKDSFVTLFGGITAMDINKFNTYDARYLTFKHDSSFVRKASAAKTSSVFSKASSWGFAAAGLALGLVGGALIGTAVKRKKEETAGQ